MEKQTALGATRTPRQRFWLEHLDACREQRVSLQEDRGRVLQYHICARLASQPCTRSYSAMTFGVRLRERQVAAVVAQRYG